jgi:hypothetical protein
MKYSFTLLWLMFLLRFSAGAQPVVTTTPEGRASAFPHRLIVKFRPEASANPAGVLSPVAAQYGISSLATWLDPRLLAEGSSAHKQAMGGDGP